MSQQSGQHPISLQYPVRTSKAGYQLAGPGERPHPQGNQATHQGLSAALVAVQKNAELVSQFSGEGRFKTPHEMSIKQPEHFPGILQKANPSAEQQGRSSKAQEAPKKDQTMP